MEVPPTDFEASGEPIKSPLDFDGLVEAIKVLDREPDQKQLIGELRALSESDILKLTRMKVPGVNGGKRTVLEHLCVMKPSSKEVFCDVLKILLGNAVVDNQKDDEDGSADTPPLLHLAAYCGNYEAVTILCSTEGTNIFAKDRANGFTALHAAVISGDTRIARDLLVQASRESFDKYRELLSGADKRRMTPLHYAAWEGDERMTKILLNWQDTVGLFPDVIVNAEPQADHGFTALHLAAMNRHIGVLRLLLDLRNSPRQNEDFFLPNVNITDSESMRERILDELDEAESHILQFSSDRRSAVRKRRMNSPLTSAVVPLWKELRRNPKPDGTAGGQERKQTGAEADKELEAFEDPLMFFVEAIRTLQSPACGEAYQEVFCGLLLSLPWRDIRQLSRLKVPGANGGRLTVCGHLCVTKPCLQDVLKMLIRGCRSINLQELEGNNPIPLLHLAAYCSNYAAVKAVCDCLNVVLSGSTRLTALQMAVKGGDKEGAEWIINTVVQFQPLILKDFVNSKDDLGMTPLHYAVWEGNLSMLEFLFQNQNVKDVIDINAAGLNGLTPLHLASLNNDNVILSKLLNDPRINVNAIEESGFTALHVASAKNHVEVLRRLLDHQNINVNVAADNGCTALHMASWNNHTGVLQKLLDHLQINVNVRDMYGRTALDLPQEESDHQMSIGATPRGKSITESLQMKMDELESHLWQFAVDRKSKLETIKEERRQRTAIPPAKIGPQVQQQLLRGENNLTSAADVLFHKPDLRENGKFTALHSAVRQGNSEGVTSLMHVVSKAARARATLNALDVNGMTALHFAVMRGDAYMVEDLLSNKMVRGNIREELTHRTPLNMAYRLGKGDHLLASTEDKKRERREILREYKVIIGFLLEHPDVKAYIESLYRDRQLFVDAANAILVGAALIASITFAGWLQPPLGYQPYYDSRYLLNGSAPPDTYATYATVGQHVGVLTFWIFNSLSFFFAVATVLLGACVVLPMLGKEELEADVRRMRNLHVWTTLSLSFSVLFVLGAFMSAGFSSLPPELEYQWGMIATTAVGGSLSIAALSYYLYRVITLMNMIRRAGKGDL